MIWAYLQNKKKKKKKFNTVHNLITFSMVFTNKNGGGHFEPPLIITNVCKPPIITKVKIITPQIYKLLY